MSPRTVILPLALLALLSGCGSGGGRPTAVQTPTTSPTAAPQPSATASTLPSARPSADSPEDPLSPRPALESPAPLGQPTCAAAALTVTDADTVTDATTTHEVFVVRTSGRPCQLDGWPAVRLLDGSGKDLGVAVGHGGYGLPGTSPAPVTLSASTTVSFVVATARTGACRGVAQVAVTLPGTSSALRASTTMQVCGGAGTSPVQRLADTEGEGQTTAD